ncbi:hypothetical protein GOP47_0006462 [Adiantum capillus-veneris]|uniref:Acyl-coenzyme A oxidase n=1 Tax=Adiantum capillus-veneris TaxID=13818 RepID=A0A9D4ZMI2_ADICA|nr:hypothetical protein GOP47_0006462 [Adiantum capillus-veneris]
MEVLIEERQKSEFEVRSLKVLFWGGEESFEMVSRMATLAASDPVFKSDDRVTLSRGELIKSGLKKAAHVRKLVLDLSLSDREAYMLRIFVDERSYADLHWNMFVPALEGQATKEQQDYWLPLARSMKIIGCYAQTELGHGSNVRGIETTATFNAANDEFILETPTITSTKWWPGGLGKVATHALIQARLLVGKEDYGTHAFIVQLRDLENHKLLAGVKVGDIGTKYGNNTVDNGYLHLESVCIPRMNMLMRMAEVTKEGKYKKSDVPRQILYGAMVTAREIIISEAAINLSRAVTIAVRYSAVRRQFSGSGSEGMPEEQVLNYVTQQQRLFPLLAAVYAYQFSAQWLRWLYEDVQERIKKNDFSTLPEVHSCTAGLKALTTSVTAAGIEECRKLCGGHGYLCSSGIPELYAAYLPSCTYEGENIILFREVGRILLRTFLDSHKGKNSSGTTAYISRLKSFNVQNCGVVQGSDFFNEMILLRAFEMRSLELIRGCARKVLQSSDFQAGLDEYAVDIVEMAQAHCQLIVISKFLDKLQGEIPGPGVREQLQTLYYLYALSLIKEHIGDFLSSGYLTRTQASLVTKQLLVLYAKIRPNVVALVDAFNHTDHFLGSTLGSYDGDAYNRLYKGAWRNNPLNDTVVTDGYSEYIRPILTGQLGVSRL